MWALRTELEPNAVDKLALGFIAAVAIVTLALYPRPAVYVVLLLAQAGAIVFFAWLGARSRIGRHVHAFAPIVLVLALFETIGPIIAVVNPRRYDAVLERVDARLFGGLPAAWKGLLGRPDWLTDLL